MIENQNQNNVEYKEVDMTDNSLVYYSFYMYNRAVSNLRYFKTLENKFEANEIINDLYLGSISSCYDFDELKKKGITHIISVMAGFIPPFPDDFKYLVINALDNENNDLSDSFKFSNEFIENALDDNGKVLIHCMAGRSRSATILIAYLIHTLGIDVDNILLAVQNKRNIVQPNLAFMIQLKKYHHDKYYLDL